MNHQTPVSKRIRVRIPEKHHREPVISNLVSDHNLTINIKAAMLGSNSKGDGWFDLDLQGNSKDIDSALNYLRNLDIELWLEAVYL